MKSTRELIMPKPAQVNIMKGLWRKYSSKLHGRLQGYLEEEMSYVLARISGMHDNKPRNHSNAIQYLTFSSFILKLDRKGFTRARYLSTAMVQTVRTATLMVIGTTAFPANSLQIRSPVNPWRRTFVKAKSYRLGQRSNVRRSATAKFVSR